MFGSPWNPGNPLYIQESSWRTHGNITKLNVYADPDSGCLLGLKATYGWQAANARRLGVEKAGEAALPSLDIKLSKEEFFNKAQYKFGRCGRLCGQPWWQASGGRGGEARRQQQ
jgi:hypothetical protein